MKIAIACVMQESNCFAPALSTLNDFQIDVGSDLIRVYRGTNTEIGGFLDGLDQAGFEPVPLVSAWALASGPVLDSTLDEICHLLLNQIQGRDFEGLLIALHGAWVSESLPSADAELIRRLRARIGDEIPILATLDLHANVRPALAQGLWGAVGYRTYPHVDMAETGRKAVRLMRDCLSSRKRQVFYWEPIPFMAPPQVATTDRDPLRGIFAKLDESLTALGALSSSFFCVQPWLDIEETASSFLVAANSQSPQISAAVKLIASHLWDERSQFSLDWVSPESLLDKAEQFASGPVIVSEGYDATTGGAPGDHPGLLQILFPHRAKFSACIYLVDPVAVQQARSAGSGGEFHGNVGAYLDNRYGDPVSVKGKVCGLSDGVFTLKGPVFTGKRIDMGPTAVIEAGLLNIVVASRAVMAIDPELYRSQGIEPREQRIVGVKSPSLFRPGYESILGGVVHLDMPGVCRGNLRKVPFRKIKRPIYPPDDFSWDATSEGVWL